MTATMVSNHAGMRELQRFSQQRFTMVGLIYALVFHFTLIAIYIVMNYVQGSDSQSVIIVDRIFSKLLPPPSLQDVEVPTVVGVAPPLLHPSVGIPVPVPDIEISPDKTLAKQAEIGSSVIGGFGGESGNGSLKNGFSDVLGVMTDKIEDIEPDTFKAVEIMPVPIKAVMPEYPVAARLVGREGTVWVKCYVDKTGKVRKTSILKSDAEIFNEPALLAAQQFVFKPAVMNAGTVGVWATIPFRFKMGR